MKYISTRGAAETLGFEDVLLAGLARDGGLFVPETWPVIPAGTIASFATRPFAEIAVEVIHPFMGGEISRDESPSWPARPMQTLMIRRSRRS